MFVVRRHSLKPSVSSRMVVFAEQKSTWKVLPRNIQMHIMKESEDEGFWERLLKVMDYDVCIDFMGDPDC